MSRVNNEKEPPNEKQFLLPTGKLVANFYYL